MLPNPPASAPSGEAAAAVHQQTDVRSVHVYENQRWNPMTGYTDK